MDSPRPWPDCSAFFRDLTEKVESFLSVLFIQAGNGESGVDDHPIAELDAVEKGEIRFDLRPEVVDSSGPVGLIDFDDLRWYP